MRLTRLTNDGPIVMQLSLEGRTLTIAEGAPGGPLAVTQTLEGADAAAGRALLDARVLELKKIGAVAPIEPDPEAKRYFDGPFFERLTREAKLRKRPLEIVTPLEERYGCRFPEDLRRLFALVETRDVQGFGEWTNLGEALTPFKPHKNLLAQAIELDRKNYLGTALRELLSCLVPIGHAGNGDVYFAFVDAVRFEGCEVFLWDHEEQSMRPFADSLSTLAYLNHLRELDEGGSEVEGDVLDATRAGLLRLERRVAPSWHYRALCENAGVTPSYTGVTGAEALYYRATWVHALVRSKTADAAAQAKALVGPNLEAFHQKQRFSSYLTSPRLRRSPAQAYWLFYTWFFDDEEGFAQAVSALSESRSTFSRDAAALFAPLLEARGAKGRRTKAPLGAVTDAVSLKKKFLAAETARERHARLEQEKAEEEAARGGLLAEADVLARGATAERLHAAARENEGRPAVVERLFEHLAALDPDVARARRRLDLLADSGRYREHGLARTWLAVHATRAIVPLAAARGAASVIALLAPPPESLAVAAPPEVTREALSPLRTEASRKLQVALARAEPASEAHLAVFDEVLAKRRGSSVYIVFERLMREALAGRLGRPVDLEVVRRALGVTYSERERTEVLHCAALEVLARHAPTEEVRRVALRFLTWDLARVRASARDILRALGEEDRTRVLDRVEAEDLAAAGPDALLAALRDRWAYPKAMVVEVACERGWGEAIAADAIAAFLATYAPFVEGHGYYGGNYDVMLRTARAIAAIPGLEVDAFLHQLVTSRSPLLSPAIEDAATKARARPHGSPERVDEDGPLTMTTWSAPPFVVGSPIRGLARAGGRLVAVGPRSALFDESGRGRPLPEPARLGFAYDVDVDPSGALVAIGQRAGRLVVLDLTKDAVRLDLQLGGPSSALRRVRFSPSGRFVATASDDETIHVVDRTTGSVVTSHREPYDVNGVAWVDEDRLAFITAHHVGVLPRVGGEPKRLDVGGGADVLVHEGKIVAATVKHGIAWLDPATLRFKRKLPQKGVARVRIAPDGTIWAAVHEGEHAGLACFPPGENATAPIAGEPMLALELDASGGVLAGGEAGIVHRVGASGAIEAPPEESHRGAIVGVTVEAGGAILALDRTARVLRWSAEDGAARAARAVWTPPEPPYAPHTAAPLPGGDVLLGAFKKTTRLSGAGLGWEIETARSEALLVLGDAAVLGDGAALRWVDLASGRTIAEVAADVKGSWIAHLFAVDEDAFVVIGHDDPKLARWSASRRTVEHAVALDRRREDGRFARLHGVTQAARSRRLYASAWNETVEVIDPRSLEVEMTYDVPYAYERLAVDDEERWLLLGSATVLDLLDLRTGERVARRSTDAPITSLAALGPGRALVGLASGELLTATWPR